MKPAIKERPEKISRNGPCREHERKLAVPTDLHPRILLLVGIRLVGWHGAMEILRSKGNSDHTEKTASVSAFQTHCTNFARFE